MTKIFAWFKTYWKPALFVVVLVVIGILTLTIFQSSWRRKIKQIFKTADDSHKEQVRIIEHENKKNKELNEKALKKFLETKTNLNKQLEHSKTQLKKSEEKRLKELVDKYMENPDELTRKIAEEFGLEYVETSK